MARRRRRGDGTVFYDHAEGVWIARISLGQPGGKRVRHKARAHSEAAARAALETLQRTYGVGGDLATMTLDAYLADWLKGHGPTVRPSTLRSYRGHIKHHIGPFLGGIPVAKLRRADVRRLIADRLAHGTSPATVGRIISTLRVALGAAVADHAITDNAAAVPLPRVEREPVRVLTIEDAERVMDAVAGHPLEPLYVLLLGSGLRLGEALGLDWRDVHLDDGYVSVRVSKTRVRATPISDEAVDALRLHMKSTPRYGPDEPVFLGLRGKAKTERLGPSAPSHALPRLLQRAGLRPMRVHDLRHGTASLMLAAGTPMRVISEQLGHANPSMTAKVYAHVLPESQRAAVRALNVRRRAIGSRNGSRDD